jgi:hypothetical protein
MKKIFIKGQIDGENAYFSYEIMVNTEKIACVGNINGKAVILLEGGVRIKTDEEYSKVLAMIV